MGRLPETTRDALPPEGQVVWDRIAAVRVGVRGPYSILIHVPDLADRVRALEDYFRFESTLSAADRELVTLVVGHEMGAQFGWAIHVPAALKAGLSAEAIEALRMDGPLASLSPRELLLVEIARTLLRTRTLPDALFARGLAVLGERTLVEVVILAGHYSMIGLILNGFNVPPPEDRNQG